MSISLGTLSFGVEADTSKLDKDINKSEQKISRFSMLGLQRLNALNSFNINSGTKKIESLNEKIDKLKNKSSEAAGKLEEIDQKMRNIREDIAETSGLNLQYDTSQNKDNRMTTTQYDEKLEKLAMQNKEYQKLVAQEQNLFNKTQQHSLEITKINGKIATIKNNISEASKVQGISNTFTSIGTGLKNIGTKLGSAIRKTIKWGTVLFGVGGAVSLITRGVNAYLDTNPQIKANLDYMIYAIGQALAPAIHWVVNLFQQLLGIIGAIAQVFFGVNLFANSFSNYMKSANKNSSKVKKNLGTLAGFDEINNIGGDTTTNGASGITAPNMPELSSIVDTWIPKIQQVKNLFEEWKWVILGVGTALLGLKIGSILGASIPTLIGIVAIFVGLGFVIQGIIDIVSGDLVKGWGNLLVGLAILGAGVLLIFGPIPALIVVIVGLVVGLVVTITKYGEQIKAGINNFFNWLDNIFNIDFRNIFGPVVGGILNSFVNTIHSVFDGVRMIFTGVIDFIQGIFTGNWSQALNGLLNILKGVAKIILNVLLAPFKTAWNFISGIFESIKNGWNKLWNSLNLPHIKLPHLTISYEYNGFKAEAAKLIGLQGWPKFGVQWYKNGGVFGGTSIIGVGEYVGAKSNPEIAAPQSMIYQTTKEAMKDSSNFNNSNEQKLIHLTMIVDSKKTFDDIIEEGREYERKNGVKIFAN